VVTLTTSHSPRWLAATRAISGATVRHGPHQGAQKSTTTGKREAPISASNAAVEDASMGSAGGGSLV
jgi:hypothetical protein